MENIDELDIESIVWKLFKSTGEIRYYMLSKALEENKELEKTNPSLFQSEEMTMGR